MVIQVLSGFTLQKGMLGTSLSYERGELIGGVLRPEDEWQEILNERFDTILEEKGNEGISKEDLAQIFAENSSSYISSKLSEYLSNLKDLSGNDIDFNSLDLHHQQQIVEFLTESLEKTDIYGTRASLSDVRVDLNGSSSYIEANLHTIDGKTLNIAAKFIPQELTDYGVQIVGEENQYFRGDAKIVFASEESLNTNQKKAFLEKIQNSPDIEKIFADFNGYIGVSLCGSSASNDGLVYSGRVLYQVSNLELNLAQAKENVKNIPKEEEQSKGNTLKFTLINMLWSNIRAEIENFNDLYKLKTESELVKENFKAQPLKTLLTSDILDSDKT